MSELADLLERYRRGAELLAVATTGAAGPVLDYREDGKWSVRQIVCHLADTEAVCAMRFRQVVAEDNPSMPATQQEAWSANLDYQKRKLSQVLEVVRILRAYNYELLAGLPEAAFDRTGVHSEAGQVTLRDLLRIYAQHLEHHVAQLQAARAAYKEFKAKQAPAPAAPLAPTEP